jgi:hypothetical protein
MKSVDFGPHDPGDVIRALFPGDDWASQASVAIGVGIQTVREMARRARPVDFDSFVMLLKYARRRAVEMICSLDGLPFRDLQRDYAAFTRAKRVLENIAARSYSDALPPPMSSDAPAPRPAPPLTPANCGVNFRRRWS